MKLPVAQVQRETSSADFLKWQAFLAQQMNKPNRTDHYLMQVAAYLAQLCEIVSKLLSGGKIKGFKIGDMLIPFNVVMEEDGEPAQDSKPEPEVEGEKEVIPSQVLKSKAAWASFLGIPEFVHGG